MVEISILYESADSTISLKIVENEKLIKSEINFELHNKNDFKEFSMTTELDNFFFLNCKIGIK